MPSPSLRRSATPADDLDAAFRSSSKCFFTALHPDSSDASVVAFISECASPTSRPPSGSFVTRSDTPTPFIMAYDPREHFQRIQRSLQNSGRGSFGGGAGGPAGRGIVTLVALGVLGVAASNALFNGASLAILQYVARILTSNQWTVVTEQLSTRELEE